MNVGTVFLLQENAKKNMTMSISYRTYSSYNPVSPSNFITCPVMHFYEALQIFLQQIL